METKFAVSLDAAQMTVISQKQSRKATKFLLVVAILLLVLSVIAVVAHFVFERDYSAYIAVFVCLDLIMWVMFISIRRATTKNVEVMLKYYAIDGVVTYDYEICETEFIVTLPAIGNVSHYRYDMIQRVNDYGDCVTVMLTTNQFLPIIVNDETAQLIITFKSVAPSGKK